MRPRHARTSMGFHASALQRVCITSLRSGVFDRRSYSAMERSTPVEAKMSGSACGRAAASVAAGRHEHKRHAAHAAHAALAPPLQQRKRLRYRAQLTGLNLTDTTLSAPHEKLLTGSLRAWSHSSTAAAAVANVLRCQWWSIARNACLPCARMGAEAAAGCWGPAGRKLRDRACAAACNARAPLRPQQTPLRVRLCAPPSPPGTPGPAPARRRRPPPRTARTAPSTA